MALEALHSDGPILEGIGSNVTAVSYEDQLAVSLLGCPHCMPDPWGSWVTCTAYSTSWSGRSRTAFPPIGDEARPESAAGGTG